MNNNQILDLIINIESKIHLQQYKGYDPYDALNSNVICPPGKFLKIAFTQLLKKSPINLRPLFFIPKTVNPKGLGLLLTIYSNLFKLTKNELWIQRSHDIYQTLLSLKSRNYSGNCWGYNFDWQNRAFFLRAYTPTVVNSSFIGHGLLDIYDVTKDEYWLKEAEAIVPFLLNDLNKYKEDDTFCFSYTPIDNTKVHNANLLGSSLISRISYLSKINDWDKEIMQSANFSLNNQQSDGSWKYGYKKYQNWIDSFHTGFNLMSLKYINLKFKDKAIVDAINVGEEYYLKQFFLKDGTPKYYNNSTYPIDAHSPSMALRYSLFSKEKHNFDLIKDWFIQNMYLDKRGHFIYQINKLYKNKINYLRWSQIWSLYGLSSYILKHNEKD